MKESDLKDLADKYEADSFMTSAKTGENVENLFKALGSAMAAKMRAE